MRLLPLTVVTPVATGVVSTLTTKLKFPPFYTLLIGSALQIVGLGLLSALPIAPTISPAQYGYQVVMGLGFGINLGLVLLMAPFVVDQHDLGGFHLSPMSAFPPTELLIAQPWPWVPSTSFVSSAALSASAS